MTANSVPECRAALAVLLVGLAPSLVSLPPAAAQATVPSMARCQQLMDAFDHYYPRKGEGLRSSSSRLDRDIAEVECQKGHYAEGIRLLEGALRRNRIPVPPES